ncbi:MAG: TIGR01906 family membrane protein [Anaerolineae bacterium]
MKVIARVLVIGLMPFFLLITNTNIVFNHWFVDWQYSQGDFPPAPTINPAERQSVGLAALDFVRGTIPLSAFVALTVNGRPAFNEREVSHMVDVRDVLHNAFIAQVIMGVLILVSLFVIRRSAGRTLIWAGVFTIVVVVLIGIFAATSFDLFFTLFHRLFFEGNSWLFLDTDTLIQLYPEELWYNGSLLIVGLTVLEALVLGTLGWLSIRRPAAGRARASAR